MLRRGLRGLLGGLLGRLLFSLSFFFRWVWGDSRRGRWAGFFSFSVCSIFIQLCGSLLPSLLSSALEIYRRTIISLEFYIYQGDWTRSILSSKFSSYIHVPSGAREKKD